MKTSSRIAVLLASLSLIGTYFLPLWRIDLWAPQYPEGLVMNIWLNKLSGDVDIINGLNHYIGMAHIKESMFPEFTYMPYLVGFFIAFGMLTFALKSRTLLFINLSLFVLAGLMALYDFWKWGYEYGHNLDPTAPIRVPGMSYQPPILGYKALLNFGAFSMPDSGGWIFLIAGLLVAGAVISEWFFRNKSPLSVGKSQAGTLVVILFIVSSLTQACSVQPEPIRYGKDACDHCKMTIVDQKFAAEIVTQKGKSFKFDDVACLVNYLTDSKVSEANLAFLLVSQYNKSGELVDASKAVYLTGDGIRSPMMGNTAAFSDAEAARAAQTQYSGTKLRTWHDLLHELH